ncbi:MAG: hypothetical protein LLG00_00425 [Planctomycetaceae bacterium]|nr:hypothetical protein [Planctomycetaceae bacterium]
MSVYRPCDIRGDATSELSAELYEAWGRGLGQQVTEEAKFVVGGDGRASTPTFLAALVDGLCQAGLDVVDLGPLPTPMIYYAKHRLSAAGCAIVTASHNPASMNGLKWMIGDRPPTPQDVAALQTAAQSPAGATTRRRTAPRTLDVSFDYVAHLQETFVDSLTAQLRVVLDPMHGAWADRVRRYLHAIFPQCLFSTIHDTPDSQFGGHSPDCSQPDRLGDLCDAVYRERAHLGVAFDGDGDRLALVDDQGVVLGPEEAVFALLACLGEELRGGTFVHDLKYSDRIAETARQLGAKPVVERSGHAFLRRRMVDTGACFGAEASGHYFHHVLGGGDDALYTACRLIAYMGHSGRLLSELRRDCPRVYMTPDLRVPTVTDGQVSLIERVRQAWDGYPTQTVDGVRIQTPGGWALMRSSVTEPALTFRFEGLDWHALDDLVERFCDTLPDELSEELWGRYRAAMGAGGSA